MPRRAQRPRNPSQTAALVPSTDSTTLEVREHKITIQHEVTRTLLVVDNSDGRRVLSLSFGPGGPVVELDGNVTLGISGNLAIQATDILMQAKNSLRIESGESIEVATSGDLTALARCQKLQALSGNVDIHANDDVRMLGERIRMNC